MRSYLAKSFAAAGLACSLLVLGACGDDKPSASATATPTAGSATPKPSATPSGKPVTPSTNLDKIAVTGKFGQKPTVKVPAPWGIDKTRSKVLQTANGPVVKAGQSVEVNYYGVDGRTGKTFDESFSRKQSVAFNLGQVVPGFQKGLVGQHQGSRVLIAMPGSDGYDSSGGNAQAGINVGDTLIFVVDLVAVQLQGPTGTAVPPKAGLPTVTDSGGKPAITIPKGNPPTSLVVQPLVKGTGRKVGANDTITFNYRWENWSGKLLEESYGSAPASYQVSGLVKGMAKGLVGQTVGSRVLLVIPPADGYPNGNATPPVQKTDTLVMVVDILFTQAAQ